MTPTDLTRVANVLTRLGIDYGTRHDFAADRTFLTAAPPPEAESGTPAAISWEFDAAGRLVSVGPVARG